MLLAAILPCASMFGLMPTACGGTFQPVVLETGTDTITVQIGWYASLKVSTINDDGHVSVNKPGNIQQFKVPPSAVITIDGLGGSLSEGKPGMNVQVMRDADLNKVDSIDANSVPPALTSPPAVPWPQGKIENLDQFLGRSCKRPSGDGALAQSHYRGRAWNRRGPCLLRQTINRCYMEGEKGLGLCR
jgi:hypothetical protein